MRNLDVNVTKLLKLRGIPLVLTATILVTGLTGCSKKAKCEVEGDHAHLYTSEDGYRTYYNRENLEYNDYSRSDEYIPLSEKDVKLYKFLDKKELIRLDENLDVVLSDTKDNHDFVEYKYSYEQESFMLVGKVPMYITTTQYAWTTDPNHRDLTGETRVCHYVYQGYNVYTDENGKYVVVPSEEVDDIHDLIGKYEYIKKTYSKAVVLGDSEEVDYENGQDAGKATNQSYTTRNEDAKIKVKR